jgi:hypothetical protein
LINLTANERSVFVKLIYFVCCGFMFFGCGRDIQKMPPVHSKIPVLAADKLEIKSRTRVLVQSVLLDQVGYFDFNEDELIPVGVVPTVIYTSERATLGGIVCSFESEKYGSIPVAYIEANQVSDWFTQLIAQFDKLYRLSSNESGDKTAKIPSCDQLLYMKRTKLSNAGSFEQRMKELQDSFDAVQDEALLSLSASVGRLDHNSAQQSRAEQLRESDLTYRIYELSPSATEETLIEIEAALRSSDFKQAATLIESLTYNKLPNGKKSHLVNSENIIVFENTNQIPTAVSPFEMKTFLTTKDSPYGQIARRVANIYQSIWTQTGGLATMSPNDQSRFAAGLQLLNKADSFLGTPGNELRGSELLTAAYRQQTGSGLYVFELALKSLLDSKMK